MTEPVEDLGRVARAGWEPVVCRIRESAAGMCSPGPRGARSRTQETLSSAGGPAAAPGSSPELAKRRLASSYLAGRDRGPMAARSTGKPGPKDSNVGGQRTHLDGLVLPG